MASRSARISLSIGRLSDGPRITGDINILGLVFALYQLWFCVSILGAPKTFAIPLIYSWPAEQQAAPWDALTYAFAASSAASLMLVAITGDSAKRFLSNRVSCILGAFLCACSCVLLICFGGTSFGLCVLCGCMAGSGSSAFICLLGRIYATFSLATSAVNATFSLAVAYICSIALINWIPPLAVEAIAVAIPVSMPFALRRSHPEDNETNLQASYYAHFYAHFTRLGVASAIFGIALGTSCICCVKLMLLRESLAMDLIFCASSVAGMLVFILAMALSRHEISWDSLFRIVGTVAIAGAVVFAFCLQAFVYLGGFAIALSFACMQALFWVLLSSLSNQLDVSPDLVFGAGYGLLQAGFTAGAFIANMAFGADAAFMFSPPQENIALLALLTTAAVSISSSVLPRYDELHVALSAILRKKAQCAMCASEDGATFADGTSSATGQLDSADAEYAPCEFAPVGGNADLLAESANAKTAQYGQKGDLAENLTTNDGKARNGENEEEPKREKGSFIRRCEQIADIYLLSEREKEVLFLLAKGHNAAFILEKLCISRSTAKTHINHIYKKMNIHSQQELLNMVEDRERGPYGMRFGSGPAVGTMGAAIMQDQRALRETTLEAKRHHDAEMAKAKSRQR